MKRWIALAASAWAVFVVAAPPVAAAWGAPAPASPQTAASPNVPSDAISVSLANVTTNGLAVTLDSGAQEDHDLVISNHTNDLRLSVKLTATDASGNLGAAAASWLAFADDIVSLDPHSAVTVPMTVAVPHDTQPGSALAHVVATVESAVAAADGSPRSGTAKMTFPVSITVRGTPTAQIAIADVHRIDKDSRHELGIILRNYGNQGAKVTGHVRVGSDNPQVLEFKADLAPTRDTTVTIPWNAPPENQPADVAVEVNYGGGNVASWSSTIGGPPTTIAPPATDSQATTDSTLASDNSNATGTQSAPGTSKPWWKSALPFLIGLAILGAGAWFFFELRGSKHRRERAPAGMAGMPFFMAPPGWGGGGGSPDATAELAKQLVALTEIIVRLTTQGSNLGAGEAAATPARARSPGSDTDWEARAGPEPDDRAPPLAVVPPPREPEPEPVRSAPPAPGASARPETNDPSAALVERLVELEQDRRRVRDDLDAEELAESLQPEREPQRASAPEPEPEPEAEPEADAQSAILERLMELDRERRRFRTWMDAEEAGDMEFLGEAPADPFPDETS